MKTINYPMLFNLRPDPGISDKTYNSIEAFYERFSFEFPYDHEGHFFLACMASFPMVLTADLLYRLRANFQFIYDQDGRKREFPIPIEAVSDLLLQRELVREVGFERFEIYPEVRDYLAHILHSTPSLGRKRVVELALFLRNYTKRHLQNQADPKLTQVQYLTAEAFLNPIDVSRELTKALNEAIESEQKQDQVLEFVKGITVHMEGYEILDRYARGLQAHKKGDVERAKSLLKDLPVSEKSEIYLPGGNHLRFPAVLGQYLEGTIKGSNQAKEPSSLQRLNALPGLAPFKKYVKEILELGGLEGENEGLKLKKRKHVVFSGNPGTGKTTAARILGEIYSSIGILKRGHFVEVNRSDLVGEYVGQTAIKTRNKIYEAIGGILFIDEVYSLYKADDDSFGQEAIDTLLKMMEDHREDFIVIVGGSPERMEKFLDNQPGLRARIPDTVNFPDYSIEQLLEVFWANVRAINILVGKSVSEVIIEILKSINEIENFQNAQAVGAFLNLAKRNHSHRCQTQLLDPETTPLSIVDIPVKYLPSREESLDIPDPSILSSLKEVSVAYSLQVLNDRGDSLFSKTIKIEVPQGGMEFRDHKLISDQFVTTWEEMDVQATDESGELLSIELLHNDSTVREFRIYFPNELSQQTNGSRLFTYSYRVFWAKMQGSQRPTISVETTASKVECSLLLTPRNGVEYVYTYTNGKAPKYYSPSIPLYSETGYFIYKTELEKISESSLMVEWGLTPTFQFNGPISNISQGDFTGHSNEENLKSIILENPLNRYFYDYLVKSLNSNPVSIIAGKRGSGKMRQLYWAINEISSEIQVVIPDKICFYEQIIRETKLLSGLSNNLIFCFTYFKEIVNRNNGDFKGFVEMIKQLEEYGKIAIIAPPDSLPQNLLTYMVSPPGWIDIMLPEIFEVKLLSSNGRFIKARLSISEGEVHSPMFRLPVSELPDGVKSSELDESIPVILLSFSGPNDLQNYPIVSCKRAEALYWKKIFRDQDLNFFNARRYARLFPGGRYSEQVEDFIAENLEDHFQLTVSRLSGGNFIRYSELKEKEAIIYFYESFRDYQKDNPNTNLSELDYKNHFYTGAKIDKILAGEPIRLLTKIPEVDNVILGIYENGQLLEAQISRDEAEKFLGLSLESISIPSKAWEKLSHRLIYNKDERSRFRSLFVSNSKLPKKSKSPKQKLPLKDRKNDTVKVHIGYYDGDEISSFLARTLFDRIRQNGGEIKLDIENNLVGIDWAYSIIDSIEKSDFSILLLSPKGIQDYILQAKIQLSLKYQNPSPLGSSNILPILMGNNIELGILDSEIVNKLNQIQSLTWQGEGDTEKVISEVMRFLFAD